ncbi:MAG: zinc ribbon domain-containing protein [Planctomycetota bacterium]|jgi:predicted  nucleic acid-binding Zn-ribbon protein
MTSETNVATEAMRALHRIHRQLQDLKGRLQRGPGLARARQGNVDRREAELAGLQGQMLALKVAADDKQVQLASGEAAVEKRKIQLRQAGDNREFQALKDEIAAAEMANSVLEDEILEALDQLDSLSTKVEKAKTAVAKAQEEAEKTHREFQDMEPRVRGDIERLGDELGQSEAALPGEFRELYRRVVRQKGEDALAQVKGEFCEGCNQHVPVNLINELMLNRPAACKSCGRLLYLPEGYSPR